MLPTYPQIEISPVTCLTGGRNDKNPRLKDKFSTFFYSPQAPNTAPPKALHECSRKTAKVVFKTWLHLKTQKVVHQSQTGALEDALLKVFEKYELAEEIFGLHNL